MIKLNSFFSSRPDILSWAATPIPPLPFAPKLKEWINNGFHGSMDYMEKNFDKRTNPYVFKPWAKSAIMFMLKYPLGLIDTSEAPYPISSYSLGIDYHVQAREILGELEKLLRDEGAVKNDHFYGFADTASVMERELAAEAGLGWRGKNCCTISRDHGSAFFLAGCFVDFDIQHGEAQTNNCGKCAKCLEACPTGALIAPGVMDARKCISYLTIENREDISNDLKNKTGNWIFGCDICQQVCPWNKKHLKKPDRETAEKFFLSEEKWRSILEKGGGFKSMFKNTPLQRAGRKLMLRNLENAVKNSPFASLS